MASIIYNSFFNDLAKATIDLDTHTFKCCLMNSTYAAIADETKKDSHDRRDDITGNEATGTNYTAGGTAATVTVNAVDTANNRQDITLGAVSWANATISANGAVYYRDAGAAASDPLICYIDFGGAVAATAGTFSLTASTLRFSN